MAYPAAHIYVNNLGEDYGGEMKDYSVTMRIWVSTSTPAFNVVLKALMARYVRVLTDLLFPDNSSRSLNCQVVGMSLDNIDFGNSLEIPTSKEYAVSHLFREWCEFSFTVKTQEA